MASMASACALVISNDKSFNQLNTWKSKAAASTCLLVTVSVVCVCILVVCGVLIVREYSLAVAYKRTSCWVENVTYSPNLISCDFCPGHKDKSRDKSAGSCIQSQFPCVRIHVGYQVNEKAYTGLLHPNSLQAAGIYSKCSFNVCMRDIEENRKAVTHHANGWRALKNNHFDCFYNSADSDDVISHKMYTQSDVIHCMLWPSLVIVACCGIFLSIETRRRKLTFCGRRASAIESNRTSPDLNETEVVFRQYVASNGIRSGGSIDCRLVSRTDVESKGWKSYSSLDCLNTHLQPWAAGGMDVKCKSFDRLNYEMKRELYLQNARSEHDQRKCSVGASGSAAEMERRHSFRLDVPQSSSCRLIPS